MNATKYKLNIKMRESINKHYPIPCGLIRLVFTLYLALPLVLDLKSIYDKCGSLFVPISFWLVIKDRYLT